MNIQGRKPPLNEGRYIASIDLGSHTARFLVCEIYEPPILFRPIARKRYYTNLAKGFDNEGAGFIDSEYFKKAVSAVEDFYITAEEYSVEKIVGAATGIFRRAKNSQDLLNVIKARTGIEIPIVSGEEEAAITLKGVFHALKLKGYPDAFFDLGGSTTEFIFKRGNKIEVISLPIGAFVLTGMFLKQDPPAEEEIHSIKKYIDNTLKEKIGAISDKHEDFLLIGSGGTVTSLAAIINNIDKEDVTPDIINGSVINSVKINGFYESLKPLSSHERVRIKNIDEGRAKVILAGTVAVMSITEFFKTKNLTVSYSDILEGLILSYLEGEKDE
ncbi:MAG: hypothetical protein JXL81_13440 [Deltaproteobacteria bacterium]|nr:hypothetical protein [Deltaproteobacteria bacterium]